MSVQWLEICRQVSNGDLITRKTTHNMRKIMEERLSIMIVIVSSLYSKTTKPSSSSRQNAGITKPFNITSHEDFKTFYLNVNIPTQCQNRSYQLTDDEFLSNQSLREWGIRLWPRRRHLSIVKPNTMEISKWLQKRDNRWVYKSFQPKISKLHQNPHYTQIKY